jgi:D-aspartate ligase
MSETTAPGAVPTNRPIAVVLDVHHITGLNTVRSLARMNVPVIGLTSQPQSPLARTNKCRIVRCPASSGDALLKTLMVVGRSFRDKAVLFPCSDAQVADISAKRELLAAYYRFNLPAEEVVTTLSLKASFAQYAHANGYSIPRTAVIDRSTDITARRGDFTFPCILKPDTKTAQWTAHNHLNKAWRLHNEDELQRAIPKALQWVDRLVVQEWVPGSDSDLYFSLVYFDASSEPRATFVGRKIRQWVPEMGSAASAEKEFSAPVLAETIRLFKSVQYKGLGYVEFKLDAHQRQFTIIETNVGRPVVPSHLAVANGINTAYVAYCDLIGTPITLLDDPTRPATIRWVHEWSEYQSANYYFERGELTTADWARSISGPKSYALFSPSDPLPFTLSLRQVSRREMAKFLRFFLRLVVRTRKRRDRLTRRL